MSETIKRLQAERASELEKAQQITVSAKDCGEDLTDEELSAVNSHVAKSKDLAAQIEAEEKRETSRLQALADLDDEVASATRQPEAGYRTNPSRSDSPSIRAIRGEATGKFEHFGEFLFKVRQAAELPSAADSRLRAAPMGSAPGMRGDVDSLGGFLIPDEYSSRILERMYSTGELLSRIKAVGFYLPLQRNTIKIPRVVETSRADGARSGGIRGYWVGETSSITDSKPAVGQMTLTLNKAGALGYITEEMLEDAPASGAFLERLLTNELLFTVEDAIVTGDGSAKPLGLTNANCAVSVTIETNQTGSTVWGPNITSMWARLFAGCRKTSVWLVDQSVEPFLFSLTLEGRYGSAATSVEGIPLYYPAGSLLNQGQYGILMGRPVIPVEYCAAVGTVGDIILWDPASYVLVDKAGDPKAASSIHVRFATDEQTFKATYRVDGQPTWASALTPHSAGDSLSCIVTLAART
ncbi:MAG TPA: phage major capsid protein [Thermoguttaceae bacterium]|nr:phage major capsid protein [Thermoguttaceae bacterium]